MYQYGCGFPTLRSARSFLAAHNLRQLIDVNYSCSRATTILAEPEQVDGTPRRPRGGPGGWGERSQGQG